MYGTGAVLQGGLPRNQPDRSEPRDRVRRVVEPVPRLAGDVSRLSLRPVQGMLRVSSRHRQHNGEEDIRPTDQETGHLRCVEQGISGV